MTTPALTPELLEKIEAAKARVLTYHELQGGGPALLADSHRAVQQIRDLELLTRAYLALCPADDEETVTEEWLRSIGFHPRKFLGVLRIASEPKGGPICTLEYDPLGGCDGWRVGGELITPMETRGQLRALCSALMIPLLPPGARSGGEGGG